MQIHWRSMAIVAFTTIISGNQFLSAADERAQLQIESWPSALRVIQKPPFMIPGFHIDDWVFDAIDDISLFDMEVGDLKVGLKSERRVFENNDKFNTYTVIDRFQSRLRFPFFAYESSPFEVWFGTKQSSEILDIRQIHPEQLSTLPAINDKTIDLQSSEVAKDFQRAGQENEKWNLLYDKNGKRKLTFFADTPENQARFGDLFNSLSLPFRLPWNAKALESMQGGEVISYFLEPSVELGAGLGWDIDMAGLAGGVDISGAVYARLQFRVSVMKEDDRFMRVKRTILLGKGVRENIGESEAWDWLEGIIILSQLKNELRLIPFQIKVQKELAHSMDRSYRYDMSTEEGQEAYHRAALGDFTLSERLAMQNQNTSSVTWLSDRDSRSEKLNQSQKLKLAFFYTDKEKSSLEAVDAVITTPDGKLHTFRSLITDSRDEKTIWGTQERRDYSFEVNLDLDAYASNPHSADAFTLTCDANILDTDTTPKELHDYISESEKATGAYGLFPAFVMKKGHIVLSRGDKDDDLPFHNYGKSHFFYSLNVNQHQLEKFIDTPKDKIWPMLETVFRAPKGAWHDPGSRVLGGFISAGIYMGTFPFLLINRPLREGEIIFQAQKIYDRWIKTKNLTSVKDRVEELGRLFYKPRYSWELIQLLKEALPDESIDFVVQGENPAFGIFKREKLSPFRYGNAAEEVNLKIEFDREGPRP